MAVKSLKKIIQHKAYRLVFNQLACVFAFAAIALPFSGLVRAFSVLAGGLAYGLPNLFFVWRVFRYAGANEMSKFMAAFFVGEMVKLFLSAILFLMIVKYLPVSLLSVLVGFVVAIVSFWMVCIWHFSKPNTAKQKIKS
jgi:ATP synthase protein I